MITRKIRLCMIPETCRHAESAAAKEAGESAENAWLTILMSNGSHNRPGDPPRADPSPSATDRILPLSTRERREMARAIALETLMRSMEPREARVVGRHPDVLDSEEA